MSWHDGNFDTVEYMAMSGGEAVSRKMRAGAAARCEAIHDRRFVTKDELLNRKISVRYDIQLLPTRNGFGPMSEHLKNNPLQRWEIETIQDREHRAELRRERRARREKREREQEAKRLKAEQLYERQREAMRLARIRDAELEAYRLHVQQRAVERMRASRAGTAVGRALNDFCCPSCQCRVAKVVKESPKFGYAVLACVMCEALWVARLSDALVAQLA
jgi:hypothetical protein